ncbi:MAG: hypothetical protein V1705_00340 [bacterium]
MKGGQGESISTLSSAFVDGDSFSPSPSERRRTTLLRPLVWPHLFKATLDIRGENEDACFSPFFFFARTQALWLIFKFSAWRAADTSRGRASSQTKTASSLKKLAALKDEGYTKQNSQLLELWHQQ